MNGSGRRIGLLAALVALVVIAVAAGALDSWLSEDWLRTDLERVIRHVREHGDEDGYDVVRLGDVRAGDAAPDEQVTLPLEVDTPGELAVAAVCDHDCTDLALRILDRNGDALASDEAGDAVPLVSAVVEEPGSYELQISMKACGAARCRYAWQPLRISSREGGGDESITGTCFSVGPVGLLLTARDVIEVATHIEVRFAGGPALPASVERADRETDLALLRIAVATPEYLSLAAADSIHLGEPVFTVGFPAVDVLGEEPKYNDGTIGALAGLEGSPPSIQLSIPVQPGSSGGPVVNDHGEVVGIIEAVADADFFRGDTGLVPQSLSWAVKAEVARALIPATPPRATSRTRAEAVERVLRAVCLVEAE